MEGKAISILFEAAKEALEGMRQASSGEEVDNIANVMDSLLTGMHEIIKNVIQ